MQWAHSPPADWTVRERKHEWIRVTRKLACERLEAVSGRKAQFKVANRCWSDPSCGMLEKVSSCDLVNAVTSSVVLLDKIHSAKAADRDSHCALREAKIVLERTDGGVALHRELQ
jgi:hypothetical protein